MERLRRPSVKNQQEEVRLRDEKIASLETIIAEQKGEISRLEELMGNLSIQLEKTKLEVPPKTQKITPDSNEDQITL